jgi:hypothetical protein
MTDMKHRGLSPPRQMSAVEAMLLILIVAFTAWSFLPESPKVVMTPDEYQRAIAQARIEAAREAFTAVRADGECWMGWKTNPRASVNPGAKPKGQM